MTHHHAQVRTWSPAGTFTVVGAAMTNTPSGIVYSSSDSRYYTDESSVGGVVKIAEDGTGQTRVANSGVAIFGSGLIVGLDGNLWLEGYYDDTIGGTGPYLVRLTTGGTWTNDAHPWANLSGAVPTYGAGPINGPAADTASMYAEWGANILARYPIGSFGTATAYAWFTTTNAPVRGCLGPDDLLWTMGLGGATAGNRVLVHWNAATSTTAPTAAGTVTVAYTGSVRGLRVGPDNNMWILYDDRLLVYSTATTPVLLSTFVFTTTTGTARDMCVGPDGAMWVTLGGATNRLVRCTTTGTITEYAITTDTSPWGICAGADSMSLWFVSRTTKKFIKFT